MPVLMSNSGKLTEWPLHYNRDIDIAMFEKTDVNCYTHSLSAVGTLNLVLYKRGVELTEFDIRRCDCSCLTMDISGQFSGSCVH